jgi:AcrR family transcriptional regulator
VERHQRRRLQRASAELLSEEGLKGTSAKAVARRAEVSFYTFYSMFDNVEDLVRSGAAEASRSLQTVIPMWCQEKKGTAAKVEGALFDLFRITTMTPTMRSPLALGPSIALGRLNGRETLAARLAKVLAAARAGSADDDAIYHPDELLVAGVMAFLFDRPTLPLTDGWSNTVKDLTLLLTWPGECLA